MLQFQFAYVNVNLLAVGRLKTSRLFYASFTVPNPFTPEQFRYITGNNRDYVVSNTINKIALSFSFYF